jgi:hypothetical protein
MGDGTADCRRMSQNTEADGESLKSLDLVRGTSAKGAGRSRDVECRKRHARGRREGRRPLNASSMIVIQTYSIDSVSRTDSAMIGEKIINCRK